MRRIVAGNESTAARMAGSSSERLWESTARAERNPVITSVGAMVVVDLLAGMGK
ncbi:hypothetical protein [Alloactinosynnema sp. L-07]|nr:hypothetical protein [Alloactinosynnema sp. L-07]